MATRDEVVSFTNRSQGFMLGKNKRVYYTKIIGTHRSFFGGDLPLHEGRQLSLERFRLDAYEGEDGNKQLTMHDLRRAFANFAIRH